MDTVSDRAPVEGYEKVFGTEAEMEQVLGEYSSMWTWLASCLPMFVKSDANL